MSTPDSFAGRPEIESTLGAEPETSGTTPAAEQVAAGSAASVASEASEPSQAAEPQAAEKLSDPEEEAPPAEPVEREVQLTRSVRFGRVIVIAAALGAAILALIALVMPIDPSADYTRGQAVGLSLLIGAVLGLLLGAIVSLLLNRSVRTRVGHAVAIQTDVR